MSIPSWLSGTFSHSKARPHGVAARRKCHPTGGSLSGPVWKSLETRLTLSVTTLASFVGTNGAHTWAGVIMDSSGNLYGTAAGGGPSSSGTVFELAQGSGTITTLASFNRTDGAAPLAGVIMDSSGNLYGTTASGGASGDGTVFELAHGSGTITTLASFNGPNGAGPHDAPIIDSNGNLYGTAAGGGA